MQLQDKVAVITGGASGIARATCMKLAREGVKAIGVVDFSDSVVDACNEMNKTLERPVCVPFKGDVVDRVFRRRVFDEMSARFGAVHICVPAAAIVRDGLAVKPDKASNSVSTYDQDLFESVMAVNLVAPIYWAIDAIATVARDRQKRGLGRWEPAERVQGAVVFIGSISSAGNKGQISYGTAKAALQGAQATLAKESIFYGVRCAIIHPGFTDTPMVQKMDMTYLKEKVLPNTQLRRLLRPEEIADGICFLIQNSAVSGALWVDAGWSPPA